MNKDLLLSWLRTILKIGGGVIAEYFYHGAVPNWWGVGSGIAVSLVGVAMSQWEHESNDGWFTKILIALGKSLPPPPATLLLLISAPFAFFAVNSVTGCAQLEQAAKSPTVQDVARSLARAAIEYGLAQLGDRVQEARPFIPILQKNIPFAIANAGSPEAAATAILNAVAAAHAPPEVASAAVAAVRQALADTALGNPRTGLVPPASGPNAGAETAYARAWCAGIAANL